MYATWRLCRGPCHGFVISVSLLWLCVVIASSGQGNDWCWLNRHSPLIVYDNCCEFPPGHWNHQVQCFDDQAGYSYEACCNYILGTSLLSSAKIRFMPSYWTDAFVLQYPARGEIKVLQNTSYQGWRHGPARTRSKKGRVLYENFDYGEESCVVFPEAEHLARAFMVGGLGHWSARQQGAPLRVLDLGTGLGVVPIAAALSGHLAVGVDFNPCMLEKARQNVLLNAVDGRAWIEEFDICAGPRAFKQHLGDLAAQFRNHRRGWFDVFTSTLALGATKSLTRCAMELIAGLGSETLTVMIVNYPFYPDDRLSMVKEAAAAVDVELLARVPMSLLGWLSPLKANDAYMLDIFRRRGS